MPPSSPKCPNCERGTQIINTEKAPEIYCGQCHISWSLNDEKVRKAVEATGICPPKVNEAVKVGF